MNKLFELIQNNNSNTIIKNYISNHSNLNLNKEINNIRIIEYIINQNNIELLEYLIKKKIDLNYILSNGKLLTENPIKYNYNNLCKILFKHIDLNLIDNDNLCSIHYSIMFHNDEIFDIILKNTKNVSEIYDNNHNNLLFYSIKYNYIYAINKLIDKINIYDNNDNNDNLLIFLEKNNINNMFNDLILQFLDLTKYTFDINQQDNQNNNTFIKYITRNNNLFILKSKQLNKISKLINFSTQDNDGNTIFHDVILYKNMLPSIYYIINTYSDLCYVNKYNYLSYTPLSLLLTLIYNNNNEIDKDYIEYFNFLVKYSGLNYKISDIYSAFDFLLLTKLWVNYKNILVHKKIIVDKKIFYRILTKDEQNELIDLLIDNHIYFLQKYKNSNKKIQNNIISYDECNKNINKCKNKFKLEFIKDNNILFKPISYNKYKFYNLIDYQNNSTYYTNNFYLTLICYMKFLESYDINCIYDNNNYTNSLFYDNYIYIYYNINNVDNIENINKIIDKLLESNKKYTIINLQISIRYAKFFHSNFLLYKKQTNTIIRIDPINIFYNKMFHTKIDNDLYNLFKSYNITYKKQIENKKTQYIGIQNKNDYSIDNDNCLLYCVLFIVFKMNNLDYTYDKLIKLLSLFNTKYPNLKYKLHNYILLKTRDYIFNKFNYSISDYNADNLSYNDYVKIYTELFNLKFINDLKLIDFN